MISCSESCITHTPFALGFKLPAGLSLDAVTAFQLKVDNSSFHVPLIWLKTESKLDNGSEQHRLCMSLDLRNAKKKTSRLHNMDDDKCLFDNFAPSWPLAEPSPQDNGHRYNVDLNRSLCDAKLS